MYHGASLNVSTFPVKQPMFHRVCHWFGQAEPIEVIELRHNYLPEQFLWRGRMCQVWQIKQVIDEARRFSERRYFDVEVQHGQRCRVFQDLRLGTWHML